MEYIDKLLRLDRTLEVSKSYDGYVRVCYHNCWIKDVMFLKGTFGRGLSFLEACKNYCDEISGKTLVFDPFTNHRQEIVVLF